MKKLMLVLLILLCDITYLGTSSGNATAENEVAIIQNSLSRWICSAIYWELLDRPNSTLPMRIRIEGETFSLWIQDFEVTEKAHMASFFVGRLRNERAAIFKHEAYNVNLTPPPPGYSQNKPLFDTKDVIKDILMLPADCTPHYDSATPQKELMLETVIGTVQKQLSSWVSQGIAKYPRELTLIIADFNIDYPSTYILVEQTKKLYSVTLHDPQNYDGDEYERSGEYPFGEVYNKSKTLLKKIRKHGIARKIVLTP